MDCEQVKNSFKHVGNSIINLFFMYVMQYTITVCYADRAWRETISLNCTEWLHENAFEILLFTYRMGMFLSRTSIQWFIFPWVSLLTAMQAALFILWTFVAIYPSWIGFNYQIVIMLLVGLVGGCSYSNCMYIVQECKTLNKNQKEVTLSTALILYEGGILLAAIIS